MSSIRRRFSDSSTGARMETGAASRCLRFLLGHAPPQARQGVNSVLAGHLERLLDILAPVKDGQTVRIDGFMPANNRQDTMPLRGQDAPGAGDCRDLLDIYEPRVSYIRHVLESLLSVVEFESGGKPVSIDGFRLKHPEQWLSPGGGAADILAHAATACNLNCRFCYNPGSPPAFKTAPRSRDKTVQDVLARIEHYRPEGKLGLFPLAGSPCEVLAHPDIREILVALRAKTPELIRIPTNGSLLDADMVEFLAGLKPLFVDVSLNSASLPRRRWLMRDPEPRTTICSLARLRDAGIPFSVVIVPWPFPSRKQMLADLRQTVDFAQTRDPAFIQVSLPGYSRFFSQKTLFDHDRVWMSIKEAVLDLRKTTGCPIILRPGLFEEYTDPPAVNTARAIGVVRNSPAARAGLQAGDRLLSLNGLPLKNRVQARAMLSTIHQSGLETTEAIVERNGVRTRRTLDLKAFAYPFDHAACPHLGVVFPSAGIPVSWVEQLAQAVRRHRARRVLVMTSKLVAPTLRRHIHEHFFPPDVQLYLRVPSNRYFGGNIFMGDLLTVDDFVAGAMDFAAEKGQHRPDLVVVPASAFHLSGWGRDLTGKSFLEIERRLGIAVALIECGPIFD